MKTKLLIALALCGASTAATSNPFLANALDVTGMNQDIIADRLSMAGPLFNGWDRTHPNGGDPWIEALMFSDKLDHAGQGISYKNKGAGVNVGYDHVIAKDFRLGLSLYGGAGRIKADTPVGDDWDGDDDGKTKFKSKWYGVTLYSTWTGNRVNVIADVGYAHEKDKLKGPLTSNGKTDAWFAGIRFETSFKTAAINWVPYYGVRFNHFSNDPGSDPEDGDPSFSSSPNLWQFPVGVKAGFDFTCPGQWKTATNLDLAIVPTAGKKKSVGIRYSDSVQYRAGLSLEASKGQHAFGLKYGTAFAAHDRFNQILSINYQFMY